MNGFVRRVLAAFRIVKADPTLRRGRNFGQNARYVKGSRADELRPIQIFVVPLIAVHGAGLLSAKIEFKTQAVRPEAEPCTASRVS